MAVLCVEKVQTHVWQSTSSEVQTLWQTISKWSHWFYCLQMQIDIWVIEVGRTEIHLEWLRNYIISSIEKV